MCWLPVVSNVSRKLAEITVQLHQVSSVEYFGMLACLPSEHILLHAPKIIQEEVVILSFEIHAVVFQDSLVPKLPLPCWCVVVWSP